MDPLLLRDMTSAFSFKRVAPVALALTAITLSSCLSEMPRFPTMPAARGTLFVPSFIPVVTQLRTAAKQEARSNRIKYSDTGIKPAVGRAGGMEMEPRALLGKDGITVVEATSGTFESPSEAVLDKISVKLLNTDLPPVHARPEATTWSGNMSGLVPGDQLKVQANITAFEGRRTVVIDAVAPVARRPDIAATSVEGPAETFPDASVILVATIRELNGERGARGNCVLSVDGTAVDQATGIWIDANGVVTCQFAYLFTEEGTHTVAVTVSDVEPGDWDMSNNSASRTVTVVAPGTPLDSGTFRASDENYTYSVTQTRTGDYPVDHLYAGTQAVSAMSVIAHARHAVPQPLQGVTARVSADGQTLFESNLTVFSVSGYTSRGTVVKCAEYRVNAEQVYSCSTTNTDGTSSAWFDYRHSSGTVTYYGHTMFCETIGCNTYLVPPYSGTTVTGTGQRYGITVGSTLRVQLSFVDAGGQAYVLDRSTSFEDVSQDPSDPLNYDRSYCYVHVNGDVCVHSVKSGTRYRGETRWQP